MTLNRSLGIESNMNFISLSTIDTIKDNAKQSDLLIDIPNHNNKRYHVKGFFVSHNQQHASLNNLCSFYQTGFPRVNIKFSSQSNHLGNTGNLDTYLTDSANQLQPKKSLSMNDLYYQLDSLDFCIKSKTRLNEEINETTHYYNDKFKRIANEIFNSGKAISKKNSDFIKKDVFEFTKSKEPLCCRDSVNHQTTGFKINQNNNSNHDNEEGKVDKLIALFESERSLPYFKKCQMPALKNLSTSTNFNQYYDASVETNNNKTSNEINDTLNYSEVSFVKVGQKFDKTKILSKFERSLSLARLKEKLSQLSREREGFDYSGPIYENVETIRRF
ncbi:unnamed protein product [Gordionus sp. m RMFG-2023]